VAATKTRLSRETAGQGINVANFDLIKYVAIPNITSNLMLLRFKFQIVCDIVSITVPALAAAFASAAAAYLLRAVALLPSTMPPTVDYMTNGDEDQRLKLFFSPTSYQPRPQKNKS
jgi:hypothetical protein